MARAAVLAGLSAYLPPRVVPNAHFADLRLSDEWISTRTGISERRWVQGQSTSDISVEAGAEALKSYGSDDIDLVILATQSPDHFAPSSAPAVASRLGLGGVPAFDLAAACSGFLYGLATASSLIRTGQAERILFIAAETASLYLNPKDRNTAPIFADGAGAVVLRAGEDDEPGSLGGFDLGSDGDLAHLVLVPGGGSRARADGWALDDRAHLVMQGRELFVNAVTRMSESSTKVLEEAGWKPDEVDLVVGHQANRRILEAVGHELGIEPERMYINIDHTGNTVAATIPIALTEAVREGALRPGHRVLLTAFGAGATWGSTLLRWPEISLA
ncbi:beta-ketoacyl-ACP synthase III [Allostreptomyces psammosilenae]|uniref:Beta-ketoacyl-[acyl-carrier-protein] synthase III n=1 Tax=Allostreptomyces psammosilenae TaxID=1892865 RepID=A0A853A2A7_9ACTN|nr:beta-ketoacyl-ACP synthase III [Allostreptomyces psammosilenae]NYI04901.1 3-oxoacyl-[acyl-carrier-protein] synthase-3 [Allostreptomyces psammosilenae]